MPPRNEDRSFGLTVMNLVQKQTMAEALRRAGESAQYTAEQMYKAGNSFARVCGIGFIDELNSLWESLGDNFELRDEEAYTPTDPISFDELMGVIPNDD